uniref:Secreted protein n=1 Tax=Anopheles dirus TaxID=7168 RepID=A0A182NWY8_9DIPT
MCLLSCLLCAVSLSSVCRVCVFVLSTTITAERVSLVLSASSFVLVLIEHQRTLCVSYERRDQKLSSVACYNC